MIHDYYYGYTVSNWEGDVYPPPVMIETGDGTTVKNNQSSPMDPRDVQYAGGTKAIALYGDELIEFDTSTNPCTVTPMMITTTGGNIAQVTYFHTDKNYIYYFNSLNPMKNRLHI